MKKIGIITMHKVYNYGSALQAYALQNYVNNLNPEEYTCEIIDYKYPNNFHIYNKSDHFFKKFLKIIKAKIITMLKEIIFFKRNSEFRKFWKEYLEMSHSFNSVKAIKNASFDYDLLITGSDQVWNPRYTNFDTIFMCDFADELIPRISYSSAIGKKSIDKKQMDLLKEHVSSYRYVSIRDKSFKEMAEEIINKEVSIVCDPTLLIDSKQWNSLSIKSKFSKKNGYILLYLLRYSFDPYPEIVTFIKCLRNQLKIPILTLYSNKIIDIENGFEEIKHANCFDFLALIKNADCIITTSFHGTCFSINFRKPFYSVVKDINNDSRIYDLLLECGLEQRMIKLNDLNKDFVFSKIDFNEEKINAYINKSKTFLKNSIGDCLC